MFARAEVPPEFNYLGTLAGALYKGDAVKAAKDLVESVPEKPETPEDLHHVMLSQLVFEKVGKDLSNIDPSLIETLYPALMEYEELLNKSAGRTSTGHPD